MALWPVMGMLDRISEHAVTICMLGSYRWCYNASKSCSHTHKLVHTDQDDLSPGQLICYAPHPPQRGRNLLFPFPFRDQSLLRLGQLPRPWRPTELREA